MLTSTNLCEVYPLLAGGFPSQTTFKAESVSVSWRNFAHCHWSSWSFIWHNRYVCVWLLTISVPVQLSPGNCYKHNNTDINEVRKLLFFSQWWLVMISDLWRHLVGPVRDICVVSVWDKPVNNKEVNSWMTTWLVMNGKRTAWVGPHPTFDFGKASLVFLQDMCLVWKWMSFVCAFSLP